MEFIKKFFADKSRIAILSVCLLMLSVVMVSALTEDTLAMDIPYCYRCLGNEHVLKWSAGSAPPTDFKCSTRYVYEPDIIEERDCNTYTIKYKANGGNGAPVDQYKAYGKSITLSSTIPTKDDYTFQGWDISSTATTVIYEAGDTYKVNDDITLYAVWRIV